jgi:phage portal protein BeeE
MAYPIIIKTVEQLNNEMKEWVQKADDRQKTKARKGVILDPQNLFYRKAEKGIRKPSRITFETLRRMSKSCSIARICINTLKHEIVKSKWSIVPVNPKKVPDKKRIEELTNFFNFPNSQDNFRKFTEKILEDVLALDAGSIELVRNGKGELVEMYHIDGSTIKPSIDINGMLADPAYYQYMPLNNTAKPDAEFSQDELVYIMENPQGDIKNFGYGLSPLEGVIMVATNILNADNYNGSFFEVGTLPPILINLGKETQTAEVESFRAYWKAEIEGKPWKTAFIGGADSPEVMKLQDQTNMDMQFMDYQMWLFRILVAAYEMSPQDLGMTFDINKATAEIQRDVSKGKGYGNMRCLLEEIFTQEIIWKGKEYRDYMFHWDDIDLVDELKRAQVWEIESRTGASSINEYRKEKNLDPIQGGIKPFIMTGIGPVYIDSTPLEEMEQGEANDEQEENTLDNMKNRNDEKLKNEEEAKKSIDGVGGERVAGAVLKTFDDKQAKDIGDKLNLDWSKIDFGEFKMGMNEELEHSDITGKDPIKTAKIALAHLTEDAHYYSKLKQVFGKTVETGNFLCWLDDRGYGQPFAWSDYMEQMGYYIKPPICAGLDGSDNEPSITQELLNRGVNVLLAVKASYKDVLNNYLPSTKLKNEFEKYRQMAPEYYSKKWEMKWGKSREFPYYIVTPFKAGYVLNDKRVLDEMKRNPTSYRQVIHDLANIYNVEREMNLGDRRANQYIVTKDKRAFGFDYQFINDEKHDWEEYKDAIFNTLKDIPELQTLFITLTKSEIKKKISYEINKEAERFLQKDVKEASKDLLKDASNNLKGIYEKIILPLAKEVSEGVKKDWQNDANDDWSDDDEDYLFIDEKKQSDFYKNVFLGALIFAGGAVLGNLGTEKEKDNFTETFNDSKSVLVKDMADIFAERSAATAKSSAMTLHDDVRSYLATARENGYSYDQMADDLKGITGWEDEWRTQRIAETESVWAAKEATTSANEELGVDEYEVLYGGNPCDHCIEAFGDGSGPFTKEQIDQIPLHPNCECIANTIIPDNWKLEDYINS